MSSWSEGYVADIGYTHGYYSELNPMHARLALLSAGYAVPSGSCHCELGFGQGVSINIHAAASGDTWYGTDFNPSQVAFAQELAEVSGASIHLYDEAFSEFSENAELPQFDSISLHGIWSWINDENRSLIVDFIRRRLKVGGLLYISYNTQPGWSAFAPMRHLMTKHAEQMSAKGVGIVNRIDGAIHFAEKLLATNSLYQQANVQVEPKLKRIQGQNRQYVAHEYFNRDWHPMYFSDMHDWLAPAKLTYLCSAFYPDHLDEANLTLEQRQFLSNISDPIFRESTRDFMVNQQFRRDYWVRGARQLSAIDRVQAVREYRVVLISNRQDIPLKIKGSRGEFSVSELSYAPILNHLADYQIHTLGDIEQAVLSDGLSLAHVVRVALALTSMGYLAAAQDEAKIVKSKSVTDKLNRYLIGKVQSSADFRYLASPVTGGGISLNRINLLFLSGRQQGISTNSDLAKLALKVLASENQGIIKNGVALTSAEDNLNELLSLAQEFEDKRLPVYKALQLV